MKQIIRTNRLKFRVNRNKDGQQVFKAIIQHPMETGLRKDPRSGHLIPANYIDDLMVSLDGKKCFAIRLGPNVSKNPYVSFGFTDELSDGQKLRISWLDNHQRETAYDVVLDFSGGHTLTFEGSKEGEEVIETITEDGPVCRRGMPSSPGLKRGQGQHN